MTATFKNNVQLQVDILGIWYNSIQPILNIQGSLPALVFQPISAPITSHFSRNGGNALGISPHDAPLTRKGPSRSLFFARPSPRHLPHTDKLSAGSYEHRPSVGRYQG